MGAIFHFGSHLGLIAASTGNKESGKLHLKGKDYIVEDGDIVHIRHSR